MSSCLNTYVCMYVCMCVFSAVNAPAWRPGAPPASASPPCGTPGPETELMSNKIIVLL